MTQHREDSQREKSERDGDPKSAVLHAVPEKKENCKKGRHATHPQDEESIMTTTAKSDKKWLACSMKVGTPKRSRIVSAVLGLTLGLACGANARAGSASATVNLIDANGVGAAIGTVTFKDAEKGLLIIPALSGLPPGARGFHIHEKGACEPGELNGKKVAGTAAGGHYDPQHTSKHLGPYHSGGHAGDLPELVVAPDGKGTRPVLAPHPTVNDIRGCTIMIHAGGDNYSDQPAPLGGGGARIACGVIK